MATNKYDKIELVHQYNICLDTRDIFLYDEINCDSAMSFIKNARLLDDRTNKPITIHQHSIGGDWTAGMAIYDCIISLSCPILFITYGFAASMGSVIPQAVYGKGLRITHKNCEWLIHEGSISLEGTNRGVVSQVEANNRLTSTMYDIYANVCKKSEYFTGEKESKVKAFLKRKLSSKEDWCISGQDAVSYGFADAVYGSEGYETIETIKGLL